MATAVNAPTDAVVMDSAALTPPVPAFESTGAEPVAVKNDPALNPLLLIRFATPVAVITEPADRPALVNRPTPAVPALDTPATAPDAVNTEPATVPCVTLLTILLLELCPIRLNETDFDVVFVAE